LETLLSFSDAGVQFKGYKSESFANKFSLLLTNSICFNNVVEHSTHNAFQGKAPVERSMLGVSNRLSKYRDDTAIGSFDMMFDGIRNELRGVKFHHSGGKKLG
jgi:hypothetical protein